MMPVVTQVSNNQSKISEHKASAQLLTPQQKNPRQNNLAVAGQRVIESQKKARVDTLQDSVITDLQEQSAEQETGFPQPELYNQHFINKYSFPKGLTGYRRQEEAKSKKDRVSIYDIQTNPIRKGVSGWKLTKMVPASGIASMQQSKMSNEPKPTEVS
jgi:hypothetical protein